MTRATFPIVPSLSDSLAEFVTYVQTHLVGDEKLERHYDQIFDYWTHIVPHRPPNRTGARGVRHPKPGSPGSIQTSSRGCHAGILGYCSLSEGGFARGHRRIR
ncbi:MAG: hypothetical protein NTV93_06370 [Verrucomicrobia bacterium]|nr:hypothetical protein [Verrucomicrobiota bacterium]